MRLSVKIAILFILCFPSYLVYAQSGQTEGKKIFSLPIPYKLPSENISILKSSQDNPSLMSTNTWVVYSDRDANPTYISPDLNSQKVKSLNFLDAFYVIDETDSFVRIFKYDWNALQPSKKHKSEQEIKAGFDNDDYGWVPKNKMLLWPHSMVNEQTFSIKALPVLKNAEAFRNPEKYINQGGTVYLYNNPTDGAKTNDNAVKMFQFLYVYKYENKKALIGKLPETGSGDFGNCILGWIDTGVVQVWRQSICIWPNDDDQAIAERKIKNIKASLFYNKDDARTWADNTSSAPVKAAWENDPYGKALADIKRMPIISNKNGVITTGNVTPVLDESGATIQGIDDKGSLDKQQGELRAHIRTINLVFVIDGSATFQNYITSIKKGIYAISARTNNSDYRNKINYSVVIYRNGKDANCADGDLSVSSMSGFSSNYNDVSNFLDNQLKLTGCTPNDNGPEAMYAGLEKGLRKFADQKDHQTNLIVLIGGNGDVTDNDKEAKLTGMISDFKVGVIAYQLIHTVSQSSDLFVTQLTRMIKQGNKIASEQVQKENPEKAKEVNMGNWTVWKDQQLGNNNDTREFLDYPEQTLLQGAIVYPPIKKDMRPDDMPTIINQVMDTTDHVIESNVEKLSAKLNGVGNKEQIKINPTLLMYFNSLGENGTTSQDIINKYIKGGYQFFISGYTSPIVSKLKYPVFSYIIFASDKEYETLDDKYSELALMSATPSELRSALCAAMYTIVATYIGDKRAEEAIKTMTADQLQGLITGLESNNELLRKHSIADYSNSKKVSDDDVKTLAKHFEDVHTQLKRIKNDKNFMFKQEDDYFYWLPDRLLNGGDNGSN